jgi:hypothetical protein
MKLYLWADPYPVHYGDSLLFSVAETIEDAKKQAESGLMYKYGKYLNDDASRDYIESVSKKLGEPIRVLDLPCAEWHEWSE